MNGIRSIITGFGEGNERRLEAITGLLDQNNIDTTSILTQLTDIRDFVNEQNRLSASQRIEEQRLARSAALSNGFGLLAELGQTRGKQSPSSKRQNEQIKITDEQNQFAILELHFYYQR
eukprot:2360000-Amphidinium_carterae.1